MAARAPSPVPPFRRRDGHVPLASYAQAAEDIRLARVLWDRAPGFYVDVGAGDPVVDSVTRLFYDAGWRGINVEPGPALARLELARPHDANLGVVVGTREGTRDFWLCRPNTELSSLVRPDPATLPPGSRLERRRVRCRRLDAILAEHGAPAIDFLKIDVEGAEREVLESVDLRRFRPLVLVVEAIAPGTRTPSHEAWEPLVLGAGYLPAAFDGINRFYVPREHGELAAVLGYPLSPLDLFVPTGSAPERHPEQQETAFPSLADELAAAALEPTSSPAERLLVLLDGVDDFPRVEAVVPAGSTLVRVGAGGTVPAVQARDELLALVRATAADVLVVSDADQLTRGAVERLCRGLEADTAAATVSVAQDTGTAVRGVPPPAVPRPRRGLVLVRRDHLVLGLEEAELLRGHGPGLVEPPEGAGLVAELLACLVRPGFVHRACERDGDQPGVARPAPATSRRRGPVRPVLLDGRCLSRPASGSQMHVAGLLGGLVRAGAEIALLEPRELHPTCEALVAPLRELVPFVGRHEVGDPVVFHRPFQVGSLHDLADCLSIGRRLVLTHQDMISDRTPAYAGTTRAWQALRRATSAALASADQVGFFSRHAALDAASDGVLELDRATVVRLGVDHLGEAGEAAAADPCRGRPYLLLLGNAYWHKNRLFALRLLEQLAERHGWDGALVLAGESPAVGSSAGAERAYLDGRPSLRDRVVDLGHVSADERHALYRGAELVLFPSLYEGFGLVPFEAAALGTASAYSRHASLGELLPAAGALPSLAVAEAAEFVLALLQQPAAREAIVGAIGEAASGLTWERTAAGYLEVYGRALERPQRGVSRLLLQVASEGLSRRGSGESRVLDVYRRRRGFRVAVDGVLGAGGVALAGLRRLGLRRRGSGRAS